MPTLRGRFAAEGTFTSVRFVAGTALGRKSDDRLVASGRRIGATVGTDIANVGVDDAGGACGTGSRLGEQNSGLKMAGSCE
jgi:hypothetical protein